MCLLAKCVENFFNRIDRKEKVTKNKLTLSQITCASPAAIVVVFHFHHIFLLLVLQHKHVMGVRGKGGGGGGEERQGGEEEEGEQVVERFEATHIDERPKSPIQFQEVRDISFSQF